jgi:SAM-dependent methyltransferase
VRSDELIDVSDAESTDLATRSLTGGAPTSGRVHCPSALGLAIQRPERNRVMIALVKLSFAILFLTLSPVYYLNRLDYIRRKRRNPFYTSRLVRLKERSALVYEIATYIENFPAWYRVYDVLPPVSGKVLQVGCGTGLLNRFLRTRARVHLTNLDTNLNALKAGVRLRRYSAFVHASIDKRTPFQDQTFDAVVFARCFHHVRDHRRALAECARVVRDGGEVIILDPVMLDDPAGKERATGYMGNSSIDGVIWRFTPETFVAHLTRCLPPTLRFRSVTCDRQLHVSNYNLCVPQTDLVAVLVKGEPNCAARNH